jgi:hypothetical protein
MAEGHIKEHKEESGRYRGGRNEWKNIEVGLIGREYRPWNDFERRDRINEERKEKGRKKKQNPEKV